MARKGPAPLKYTDVLEYALKQDGKKKSGKDFQGNIAVMHTDGTSCSFNYADSEILERWLIVYTEHTGVHVFSIDDCSWVTGPALPTEVKI